MSIERAVLELGEVIEKAEIVKNEDRKECIVFLLGQKGCQDRLMPYVQGLSYIKEFGQEMSDYEIKELAYMIWMGRTE